MNALENNYLLVIKISCIFDIEKYILAVYCKKKKNINDSAM